MARYNQRRHRTRLALTLGILALSSPALATTQCPTEFGPKDPSVNALGWLVVAIGIILGGLFMRYAIKRSRGATALKRAAAIVLGLVALGVTTIGGLALAIELFFLQC